MAKKRKAAKVEVKRKIKTVKLTPDTIVKVAVPRGVVPSIIAHPDKSVVIVPVPFSKIKKPGWFERWFG